VPDDQTVDPNDPGLGGVAPSKAELRREEEARTVTTVAEMVEEDLDDPATPSRRGPDGEPMWGTFDVPMEDEDVGEGGPSDAG
jgi:hypothetical protein